jgi:hypothetical protein
MKTTEQLNHDERMAVLRREFALLWVREILPKLNTPNPREIAAAQHEAWNKFRDEHVG